MTVERIDRRLHGTRSVVSNEDDYLAKSQPLGTKSSGTEVACRVTVG